MNMMLFYITHRILTEKLEIAEKLRPKKKETLFLVIFFPEIDARARKFFFFFFFFFACSFIYMV